jgi:hypothetical protein
MTQVEGVIGQDAIDADLGSLPPIVWEITGHGRPGDECSLAGTMYGYQTPRL